MTNIIWRVEYDLPEPVSGFKPGQVVGAGSWCYTLNDAQDMKQHYLSRGYQNVTISSTKR